MKMILIILSILDVLTVNHYEIMFIRSVNINNEVEISNYINYYDYYFHNYFYDNINKKYIKCPVGKANDIKAINEYTTCTSCSIYYKYEKTESGFNCKKCPENTIASIYNGHKSQFCYISYGDYSLNQIKSYKNLCTEYNKTSVKRKENIFSIVNYCQCPNNMPRVRLYIEPDRYKGFVKINCLSLKLSLKYINSNGLDYAILNEIWISKTEKLQYRNCDPNREYFDDNIECLCPPEQIYFNGKCMSCTDSNPVDPNIQIKCQKCPDGKILSLNGKDCMCPYSNVPQSKDCKKATENEKICSGNLVLKNDSCIVCPENQIKSEATGNCLCPEGRYINIQNNCIDCPKGKFSKNKNAKECIKCSFFKTTEGTKSNTQLQCNKINYINIVFIIGIVIIMLLICGAIPILVVFLKSKLNNQNNELLIQENEEPNQYVNNSNLKTI